MTKKDNKRLVEIAHLPHHMAKDKFNRVIYVQKSLNQNLLKKLFLTTA